MFYGRRIKELEERVTALEEKAKVLEDAVACYSRSVERLWKIYEDRMQKASEPEEKPKPKPRRRARRNHGEETPKASE